MYARSISVVSTTSNVYGVHVISSITVETSSFYVGCGVRVNGNIIASETGIQVNSITARDGI